MTMDFPTGLGCIYRTPIRVRLPPSSYLVLHESQWGLASLGTALSYLGPSQAAFPLYQTDASLDGIMTLVMTNDSN